MGRADVVLRQAHEAGYRFPANLAGFTATVRTGSGARGNLVVLGRTTISLTAHSDGAADPDGRAEIDWARQEISSIVSHRWATNYDDGDGRWAKKAEGDKIALLDDPFDSAYRVHGNTISEVHRTVGDSRFVIAVSERVLAHDGRYLPAHFTVFHWSTESGRLRRADHVTDSYKLVDGVHLPVRRRIDSATDDGITTRVLELADHVVAWA